MSRSTICCCPGGGLVELAAHLGEPAVDLLLQSVHPLFEPVEAPGGLHAERVDRRTVRVDLDAEVGQVADGGQVPCGRGVRGHLLHAGFQRGEPRFEVGRMGHGEERTDPRAWRRGGSDQT